MLHPSCAQTPHPPSADIYGNFPKVATPTHCDQVAKSCQQDPVCRPKLEAYDKACTVDAQTNQCSAPPAQCRKAMIGILGTELRVSCECKANDFRALYNCLSWHRHLWVNPCVGKDAATVSLFP